jgi:protein SCO1/2
VRAVVVLCAGALMLAGCSASTGAGNEIVSISSPSASAATTEPVPSTGTVLDLAVPASVQALALVNQDGRPIPLSSLLGKTVVISPSLTQCQEICPLISANFAQSVAAVAKAGLSDKVVFLEVTVDPWRDDLAHLKAYQQLYGASANWQFLRADPAQITQFWDGMHLSFEKVPNAPGDHPKDWLTGKPLTFDIEHQNILYVLGPDGHIKWLVDASPNVAGARLPPRLEQFLSAEGIANQKSAADPNWTAQDLDQAIAYVTGHPVGG